MWSSWQRRVNLEICKMALSTQEEALVRQLLDQQAAILSLAGNEATITSKLGATKVTLADLVAASLLADDDLLLTRQGTTDKSVSATLLRGYMQSGMATQLGVQDGSYNTASAKGSSDVITASFSPAVTSLRNGLTVYVRAAAANTSAAPTFSPNGLTAKVIVKGNGLPLESRDIAGAGHWLELQFDGLLDKWVLLNPARGVLAVPAGTVIFAAAQTAPAGFLKANGAAVSRTTYEALFAVIGTTYGIGNGTSTFNLPDLRGEFVRGADDGRGVDAGRVLGSAQAGQNASHTHTASTSPAGGHSHAFENLARIGDQDRGIGNASLWSIDTTATQTTSAVGDHTHAITVDASGGNESRPRNVALLACIKY